MSSFKRNDSGYSAPGQQTYIPANTTGALAIPRWCRYFKISGSTTITVQLRGDAASHTIWAQQGTNVEDVAYFYNSNAYSAAYTISFHG